MRRVTSLLAVVAAASLLAAQLETRRSYQEPDSQVRIDTDLDDTTFPESWKASPILASGKALDGREVERAVKNVRKALAKYPNDFLRRNLKRVVILKSMSFFGYPYGGTNSRDTVYVCDDGVGLGYTDLFIEGAVHHEFSSVLLRNHKSSLDEAAWKKALPPEFTYRGDGLTSVKTNTASLEYDRELMKKGFLNQYATSSQEEDFNVTAEALMTGNKDLWEAMGCEPLMKAKAVAVMDFYGKIEKAFTHEWFEAQRGR
ncbi:MAG: hypothetical protein KF857_06810 [Fimbriimonadaceae bacterium]|nr:hypothetical protein [Fimbriimonadaceae bacterium]